MTAPRRVLALVVAAALALAGCAVPGKGDPGVAATVGDRVITVADVVDARNDLGSLGTFPNDVGQALTLLILGPHIVDAAEEAGFVFGDNEERTYEALWRAFYRAPDGDLSPGAKDLVRVVACAAYLVYAPDGLSALEAMSLEAEGDIVVNPRYGEYSTDALKESILAALDEASNRSNELAAAVFTVFRQINAFSGAHPEWISVE